MFGLPTFPKLILIAALIAVIWYFFRRAQGAKRAGDAGPGRNSAGRKQEAAKEAKPIEDMIQCGACGAYFPANTRCSCGR